MSETLLAPQEQLSNEKNALDKRIEQAERKMGQKLLDRFVNYEDRGSRAMTPKVKHLHEVKHADFVNEELRKEYSRAHFGAEQTARGVKDYRKFLDQVTKERQEALEEQHGTVNVPGAYDDVTDSHNKLTREVVDAVSREVNATASAKEFYAHNKDKLHEAALYDAKTAGVDIKTSAKS